MRNILILAGSTFVCGTVLGVNAGLHANEQTGSAKFAWDPHRREFTKSQDQDPLAVLAEAVQQATASAWTFLSNVVNAAAASIEASSSSSSSSSASSSSRSSSRAVEHRQQQQQQQNRLLFLLGAGLGTAWLLWNVVDSVARNHRRDGRNRNPATVARVAAAGGGEAVFAVNDDEDDDDETATAAGGVRSRHSIFGKMPPPNYQDRLQSVTLQENSLNNDSNNNSGERNGRPASSAPQMPVCIICARFPRDTRMANCGHVATCFACAERLVEHTRMQHRSDAVAILCPICRAPVKRFDWMIVA